MFGRLLCGVVLIAAIACQAAPAAAATTLTVNIISDTFDGTCNTSHCSLRDAIWVANALGSEGVAATIVVPAGTFRLFRSAGASEDTGRYDDLDISVPMTIRGAGADATIVDGNGVDRVFHIHTAAGAQVVFSGLMIRGGSTADNGGGLLNDGSILTLETVTVQSNVAGGNGGGLYNLHGSATLDHSRIVGNYAGGDGGNVANETELFVNRSEISVGQSQRGGGIANNGNLSVKNSTLSANLAALQGGGIANLAPAAGAYLSQATLAANGAPDGGALWSAGTTSIVNTIMAAGETGATCGGSGKIVDSGYNIDSGTTCGFTREYDQSMVDPQLAPLAFNGGPTRTHALAASSPAVDHGTTAACESADQRDMPRPRDGNGDQIAECDVGAFEYARPSMTLPLVVAP